MKRAAAEGDATGGGNDGCAAEFITEWPPPAAATPTPPPAAATPTPPPAAATPTPPPAAATARGASSPAKVPGKQAKRSSSGSDCSDCSDDSRYDNDAEADAAVALAKFWRQSAASHQPQPQPAPLHGMLSSSSRIAIIARSAPGRTFLAQRAVVLKRMAALPSARQPALLHALASTLNYLGDVRHALEAAAQAVSLAPRKRNYEWLRAKLARHAAAQAAARTSWPAACPAGCPLRSVQRLHCSQLTTRRFFEEFALTRRPVVITGLQVTRDKWTLELVEREAGALCVDVKAVTAGSCEWAGLELQRSTTVAQFIRSIRSGGDSCACNERGYLFDWSLPQRCPALASQLIIPRYFARDLLQKLPDGCMYKDSWPSLFIAPAGISCGAHVDAFASNFWMAVLQGTKRWTIWDADALPLLNPDYTSGFDPVFPELNAENAFGHERSAAACPYSFLLHAGEVLFVPHGCPHRVTNHTTSIAISANFCDSSNIGAAVDELDVAALVGGEAQARVARELRAVMSSAAPPQGHLEEEQDLPWAQFKRAAASR